jgi:5,10-methenyltetrahydrofolate synthetase
MPPLSPSSEHIAESSVFRAALRREKLAARMALDEKTRAALAARIDAHLTALLAPLPSQMMAFCAPISGEFDAQPLASRLVERGWLAAMPIVEAVDAPMSFRAWTPSSAMSSDRYGIPIPAAGADLVPTIVLLPLVAFDPHGFRLGYGGGYFDRTLAKLVPRPRAIGVGFELGRVADIRPQAHDVPLDAMVTEAGVMLPQR